jgi:MFS family permease
VAKRGEAMGLLGVTGSLGMAAGPWLGTKVVEYFSINTLFYLSAGLALLSVLVQGTLTETLPKVQRRSFSFRLLRLDWRREVFEPRVLAPAIVTLLCLFPYGAVLTVVPDQSTLLGMSSKGLFYSFYTVASLGVRLGLGKASDTYGRVPVLRWSAAVMAVGLAVLVWSPSVPVFLTGAVVYGLGAGLNSPTLYAWTVDLSHPERRGRGIATMYIALEVGIGLGALLAGWIFDNQSARLPWVYALSLASVLAATVYLLLGVKNTPVGPAENDVLAAQAQAVASPEEVV